MSKVYLIASDRGVYISGTNPDADDSWERSAVEVADAHTAHLAAPAMRTPSGTLETILRNVFRIAGVEVG